MQNTTDTARQLCADLLKTDVDGIEFPGGNSRDAIRVRVGNQSLIVCQRKNPHRAAMEAAVLRELNQCDAPVPRLIACRDNSLIQQDVGTQRLSQCMHADSGPEVMVMLEAALASLHVIHQAGASNELLQSIVRLGDKPRWIEAFIQSAERLGGVVGVSAPSLQVEPLKALLTVDRPTFIKWDARPGNAVVRKDGMVVWIDWEHCGRRHPLDDVAWLLADEYTPFLEPEEGELIARVLPAFANGYSQARAHEYLRVFGTFHSCIRLTMILERKGEGPWWDLQQCLALDRVGVVQSLALQSCRRAIVWAQYSPLTRSLVPWIQHVQATVESL